MRTTAFVLLVMSCSVVGAAACSAPEPSGTQRSTGGTAKDGNKAAPNDDGDGKNPGSSTDNDRIPENGNPSTPTTPTTPTDPGTGGTDDCDPPGATVLGTKLLNDDLATEKGFFTSADGFPQGSWAYDGTAYRQSRIIDASDTSVFNKDPQVSNVVVEVSAASTEIANLGTTLRQIFIVMGTMVNAGSLSAVGCGIEVVSGEAVTQKTSIVRLDGPTANVSTTVLQRVNRGAVQVNEEFKMKAKLMAGTLTCDVTIGANTTTATASNLGLLKGSVGFFTRQTKALFKKASICKVK